MSARRSASGACRSDCLSGVRDEHIGSLGSASQLASRRAPRRSGRAPSRPSVARPSRPSALLLCGQRYRRKGAASVSDRQIQGAGGCIRAGRLRSRLPPPRSRIGMGRQSTATGSTSIAVFASALSSPVGARGGEGPLDRLRVRREQLDAEPEVLGDARDRARGRAPGRPPIRPPRRAPRRRCRAA